MLTLNYVISSLFLVYHLISYFFVTNVNTPVPLLFKPLFSYFVFDFSTMITIKTILKQISNLNQFWKYKILIGIRLYIYKFNINRSLFLFIWIIVIYDYFPPFFLFSFHCWNPTVHKFSNRRELRWEMRELQNWKKK